MTRDCLRVSQRLRKLYKLSTGGSMTMGGWYEQFLRDALARQEQYCRNNGIPIPPEEDDVAPPGGEKFTGVPDTSPVVDE